MLWILLAAAATAAGWSGPATRFVVPNARTGVPMMAVGGAQVPLAWLTLHVHGFANPSQVLHLWPSHGKLRWCK